MVGVADDYDAPGLSVTGEGTLLLVGDDVLAGATAGLGGSSLLSAVGGSDRFPSIPERPAERVAALAAVAGDDATGAVHDVSHGGLAVTLAEMVTAEAGVSVTLPDCEESSLAALFHEGPGRAVVETTDPTAVRAAFDGVAPVHEIGQATGDGRLTIETEDTTLSSDAADIADRRATLSDALE
jgi:phosphoribosylformylglycinamidine synthase